MIDIFMPIQSFIKLDRISIDNNVFRMHYKITVIMLLVFCVLVTSKQFFGDPIQCHGSKNNIRIIDNFCWIFGTYTLKSTSEGNYLKRKVILNNFRIRILLAIFMLQVTYTCKYLCAGVLRNVFIFRTLKEISSLHTSTLF